MNLYPLLMLIVNTKTFELKVVAFWRLMGAHGLLAPHWVGRARTRAHDGTIVTEAVIVMRGAT